VLWVRTSFKDWLGIAPDNKVTDSVKYVLTPFRKAQEKVVDEVLDTRRWRSR